jgi:hypothetical protein
MEMVSEANRLLRLSNQKAPEDSLRDALALARALVSQNRCSLEQIPQELKSG